MHLDGGPWNKAPPAGWRFSEMAFVVDSLAPEPARDQPFSITTELAACPWAPGHRLALVGIQGRSIQEEQLPPRNLVFLVDTSGSMLDEDKIGYERPPEVEESVK